MMGKEKRNGLRTVISNSGQSCYGDIIIKALRNYKINKNSTII